MGERDAQRETTTRTLACPGCGYDLTGLAGGRSIRCPECGERFALDEVLAARRPRVDPPVAAIIAVFVRPGFQPESLHSKASAGMALLCAALLGFWWLRYRRRINVLAPHLRLIVAFVAVPIAMRIMNGWLWLPIGAGALAASLWSVRTAFRDAPEASERLARAVVCVVGSLVAGLAFLGVALNGIFPDRTSIRVGQREIPFDPGLGGTLAWLVGLALLCAGLWYLRKPRERARQ